MDEIVEQPILCPACHVAIKQSDYFCFNCGKNLHPAPPSLSFGSLTGFSIGSIVLPPMGIIWGFRYIRSQDSKAKIFGFVLIGLTVIELFILTDITVKAYNTINEQIQQQLPNIQGF